MPNPEKVFCCDCKFNPGYYYCSRGELHFVPATFLRDEHYVTRYRLVCEKNANNDCPDFKPRLAVRIRRWLRRIAG